MKSKTFKILRDKIETIPVIDTHSHAVGPSGYTKYADPIDALLQGYVSSDMKSSSGCFPEELPDRDKPLAAQWPGLERMWKRFEHTGYARVTKWVLRNEYGFDRLTLEALESMQGRLLDFSDESDYQAYLDKHRVRARITNIWQDWAKVLADGWDLLPCDRPVITMMNYHTIRRAQGLDFGPREASVDRPVDSVEAIQSRSGDVVTSLDEYLNLCRKQFARFKELGAVGLKDYCAYGRGLDFANPPRADAERLFNRIMADPRVTLGWPEAKPLDDFLFHECLRMARDLDLPVQMHTGHMAYIRNDVRKANAALLQPVLEMHPEVRFDLFHGNWPYAGDFLFLGKNYPNAYLDCCWLHIIDPAYAKRLLHDSVGVMPHSKIFGFGNDYGDSIERAAGHLSIAKDNIAAALADLVESEWLGVDESLQIAADWLFNNPNEFFRLGFDAVTI